MNLQTINPRFGATVIIPNNSLRQGHPIQAIFDLAQASNDIRAAARNAAAIKPILGQHFIGVTGLNSDQFVAAKRYSETITQGGIILSDPDRDIDTTPKSRKHIDLLLGPLKLLSASDLAVLFKQKVKWHVIPCKVSDEQRA